MNLRIGCPSAHFSAGPSLFIEECPAFYQKPMDSLVKNGFGKNNIFK